MKKRTRRLAALLAVLFLAASFAWTGANVLAEEGDGAVGAGPSDTVGAEPLKAEKWLRSIVGKGVAPFWAAVGDVPFEELVARMECTVAESENERGDLTLTATYTDADTSLEFVVTGELQPKSNAAYVVTSLTNKGSEDSPKIEGLCGFKGDVYFDRNAPLTLETSKGCLATGIDDDYDYELVTIPMGVGGIYTFSPYLGRPTDRAWPYFLFTGDVGGAAVCVGWTGQWEASFGMSPKGGLYVEARQQTFSAYLEAGETVRTPSVCVMFFDGDSESGHNAMRKLIKNYYTPETIGENGENFPLPINCGIGNSVSDMTRWLENHVKNNIPTNTVWIDAAWYGVDPDNWSAQVGTWTVNKTLYPRGMKAFADTVHSYGYKLLVWFELERARETSDGAARNRGLYYSLAKGGNLLLRLDSEKGYNWMRDTLVKDIGEWGIDVYRQDFNLQPLRYWQSNDGKDRKGITENHYVTNLYRLYDELLETFPGLIIDNCSSGGRRLDIEMMARSIPMWYTDYSCSDAYTVEGAQFQAESLSLWFPFFAAGARGNLYSPNCYKGALTVSMSFSGGNSSTIDTLRTMVEQYKDLQKFFAGDYYLLFEPDILTTSWQGRQYVLDDKSESIAVIVVRGDCVVNSRKVKFKGLDADAKYDITEIDGVELAKGMSGSELMEKGLNISLSQYNSKIFRFTKVS